MTGQFLLENILPGLRGQTIGSNLSLDFSGGSVTLPTGAGLPTSGAVAGGVLVFTLGPVNLYAGSGVPTVSAPQGSLYLRTDGSSTSTRLYINTTGSTTWTNVTTAA